MNRAALLSAWIAMSVALSAHALEGDTFRPFVSFSRYYDDNLFRQAVEPKADSYNVFSFGANVDWRIKRQQVLARAAKSRVRYSSFDSLNYDGSDYLAQWNWQLGNHLNGQLGGSEVLTQVSFTELNTNLALNNLRTIRNRFGTVNWQFHPRWEVGGGMNESQATYSDPTLSPYNYTEMSQDLNLTWRTPKGTSLRTQVRTTETEYPYQLFNIVDYSYSQQELNIAGIWPYSGLLRLQGQLGYLKRENKSLSERDFSGLTGRGTADYFPSGKTVLSLSLYRELSPSSEISSNFRLATGASLNAVWSITPKITMRGDLSKETAEYLGDPGYLMLNVPVREDKTQNASLSLNYAPLRSTLIGIGLQTGRRESTNVLYDSDYKFNTIFANVRVDF